MTHVRRPDNVIELLVGRVLNSTTMDLLSGLVHTEPYRHFLLFLEIDSTGTDDHVMQAIVQFSHDRQGVPYDYKQGVFAALFWEDVDTKDIQKCYFRLRIQ